MRASVCLEDCILYRRLSRYTEVLCNVPCTRYARYALPDCMSPHGVSERGQAYHTNLHIRRIGVQYALRHRDRRGCLIALCEDLQVLHVSHEYETV